MMRFFVDSADIDSIVSLAKLGVVAGVTTNPSLIMASGSDFKQTLLKICSIIDGPVSAEVSSDNEEEMLGQARYLASLSANICVKLPMNRAGVSACRILSDQGIAINMTLIFSAAQALLAARAGAKFVSPFVGRIDDTGHDGMELIASIAQIYRNYDSIKTEILTASIRSVNHVIEAACLGADVATIPPDVFKAMLYHPLTDKGIERFNADWQKTGQHIPCS